MSRALAAAVCAAAFFVFTAAAPALQPLSGTWQLSRQPQSHQIEMRLSLEDHDTHSMRWNNTRDFAPADLGLSDAQIDGPAVATAFRLQREAGAFEFRGTAGQSKGSGDFVFTASGAFVQGLSERGLALKDSREAMTAALVDLTLAYVDAIRSAGYPSLPYNRFVAFRALGITPASIDEMKSLFGALPADQMISVTALHITKAYVEELRSAGVPNLTEQRAVEFKALGITKAYVAELARMGFPHLDPEKMVAFRAMHIDAAYLGHLAAHGLTNLTADQVIRMKASGL